MQLDEVDDTLGRSGRILKGMARRYADNRGRNEKRPSRGHEAKREGQGRDKRPRQG